MFLQGASDEEAHSWPYAFLLNGALSAKVEDEKARHIQ